jgi:hypothetical protein
MYWGIWCGQRREGQSDIQVKKKFKVKSACGNQEDPSPVVRDIEKYFQEEVIPVLKPGDKKAFCR